MTKGTFKIKKVDTRIWEVLLDGKNIACMVSHLSFDLTPEGATVTLELSALSGVEIELPDALIELMGSDSKGK